MTITDRRSRRLANCRTAATGLVACAVIGLGALWGAGPAWANGSCGQDYTSSSACAVNDPSPSAPYVGSIVAENDTDFYVLHAAADTHLSLSVTDTEDPACSEGDGDECGDVTFGLDDSTGNDVTGDDPVNSFESSTPNNGVTVPVNWSTIIPSSGTYYVEVSGGQGRDVNDNPTDTPYALTVAASPEVVWPFPPVSPAPAPTPAPAPPSMPVTTCSSYRFKPGPAITYVRFGDSNCGQVRAAIARAQITGRPHWVLRGVHWGLQGGRGALGLGTPGYRCRILKRLYGGSGVSRETIGMNVACSRGAAHLGFVWDSWIPDFARSGQAITWGRV